MTGVCLTADIDRWATPWARSAASPAQYSLTDHTKARLGPSRPSETAAWGPSKLMRVTAGGCRPAACFGGPLQLLAGCSAVYKDITSSVGSDLGHKTGSACAGIGAQAQMPVMAALRCAARDSSVWAGTPAGVGCLRHKTAQLKHLLKQAPAAPGAVLQKAALQLSKLCSGPNLLFLVRRVL